MCRSIKQLRSGIQLASEEEIHAAALQFVRKVSGYRTPSKANQDAFIRAIEEISRSTKTLLEELTYNHRKP